MGGMSISDFGAVIVRDLRAVQREVQAYPDDAMLWKLTPAITNSAGTLVLHICGNLRHFVGSVLGGVEYARNRDDEFTRRDVPRDELIACLEETIKAVDTAIGTHDDARLSARYPMQIGGRMMTTSQFLVHLTAHLGYHLGQIDYHRRILDENAPTVGNLPLEELPSVEPPADPEEFAAKAAEADPTGSLLPPQGETARARKMTPRINPVAA
jgi:uncharacterized damage-inducible protein DinB